VCRKKRLTGYQNVLTAYRQTRCEACVKFSSLYYENYMFYQTKFTKFCILKFYIRPENGRNCLKFLCRLNFIHSNTVCANFNKFEKSLRSYGQTKHQNNGVKTSINQSCVNLF